MSRTRAALWALALPSLALAAVSYWNWWPATLVGASIVWCATMGADLYMGRRERHPHGSPYGPVLKYGYIGQPSNPYTIDSFLAMRGAFTHDYHARHNLRRDEHGVLRPAERRDIDMHIQVAPGADDLWHAEQARLQDFIDKSPYFEPEPPPRWIIRLLRRLTLWRSV
jgi:hypothetical protein